MRTFLNHIKNETLDEIKTSQENLWQRMIQLSEFFQYSFMLILKRKCLVGANRVRRGESGTPSTIICTRWSSRRYELGCDAPVVWPVQLNHKPELGDLFGQCGRALDCGPRDWRPLQDQTPWQDMWKKQLKTRQDKTRTCRTTQNWCAVTIGSCTQYITLSWRQRRHNSNMPLVNVYNQLQSNLV